MAKRCPNCKVPLDWGVLCADCVRASVIAGVVAFAAGFGTAVAVALFGQQHQ